MAEVTEGRIHPPSAGLGEQARRINPPFRVMGGSISPEMPARLGGKSPALPFYNFVTNAGPLSVRLAGLKTISNQRRVG